MKKVLIVLIVITLVVLGVQFTNKVSRIADEDSDKPVITWVKLTFEGNPIESYEITLKEQENINQCMEIYQKLEDYESPKVKTWFEDVTFEIKIRDGRVEKKTFKKIRPVDDIFEKVFNSNEVKKQRNKIFEVKNTEVSKIE